MARIELTHGLYAESAQQPQAEAVPQKHEDTKRLIQWFGAVQDLNPAYLEPEDFELLARLKAPQQAEAVPPGFVLVPVEPTEAMLNAADHAVDLDPHWIARAYRAMLAAAQGAKT